MLEQGLHSRRGLVRKGCALALRGPKKLAQVRAQAGDFAATPPVLANSLPKSGTHLLDQVVAALPKRRNYGSFLASLTSSFLYRRRSEPKTLALIAEFVPGEIIRGHLWHTPAVAEALNERSVVHYLIFRDPRDVVVSETHYLRGHRWHKLHPFFRDLNSLEDAIALCICGLDDPASGVDYPHVGERLAKFDGWIDNPNVCLVRFEDLISSQRDEILLRMIRFYSDRSETPLDANEILRRMNANIAPNKSHTFRSGKSGEWRKSFTAAHRELFKSVAQDQLVRLGYEVDAKW
jgi:hypothetical protein